MVFNLILIRLFKKKNSICKKNIQFVLKKIQFNNVLGIISGNNGGWSLFDWNDNKVDGNRVIRNVVTLRDSKCEIVLNFLCIYRTGWGFISA